MVIPFQMDIINGFNQQNPLEKQKDVEIIKQFKTKIIMTSKQIISTIASMAKDNVKMTESILGGHIVKECVKLKEKPFIFKEVKPLIDSCCYLGKQIEICTEKIEMLNNQLTRMEGINELDYYPFPYEQREINRVKSDLEDTARQKELFTKQLIEAIERL